jgi:hypothetical protein
MTLSLPMNVTYSFANATTTQYLSYLDTDFNQLAWTLNGISNGTVALANVKINGGNISKTTLAANGSPTSGTFLRGDGTWAAIPSTQGGTVVSIDVSGGSTGLTTSGGPVTVSGTITLGGVLSVANGGTGVSSSTGTGSVVLSNGATLTNANIGSASFSTPLGITSGGTGIGTVPNYGQFLIGNAVGYQLGTLTAGANVTITNGPGTITVAANAQLPTPGTAGNVLTSTGSGWASQAASSGGGGTQNFQWFFGSGTFTVPAGVSEIYVALWGGGAGNQGGNTGGSGGFAQGIYAVTPGASYTVTIGSGGIGKNPGAGTGTDGGTSSFGSLITCTGGICATTTSGTGTATTSSIQTAGPSSTKMSIIPVTGNFSPVTNLYSPLQFGLVQNISGGTAPPIAASFNSYPGVGGNVYYPGYSIGAGGTGGAAYVQWV